MSQSTRGKHYKGSSLAETEISKPGTATPMDAYSVKAESGAKEAASSANETTAATLQQMFANSGALMSQLQFMQTSDGSTGGTSLPWAMMPQYQMMVVPQSLLSAQGVTASVSDGHVILTPTITTSAGDAYKVDRAMCTTVGGQSVAAILQRHDKTSASPQPDLLRQYFPDGSLVDHSAQAEVDVKKPPKKPLTPYMTFSKMVWPQVKAANPHLSSVTEIGAVVGAMWRELDPMEKQRYNDQFNKDKVSYSEELHIYLKATGLHASDLVKPKAKKKESRPAVQHNLHQSHSSTSHAASASTATSAAATGASALTSAGQQLIQTLLGLQPGALGGQQDGLASSNALSQAWASQQVQQVLAQMGLSGQTLFANSDGTISVDGGLLTIQGQPVQLAGQVASNAYSDQGQLSTSTSSANQASEVSAVDQSRGGWTWHQPTAASNDLTGASGGSAGGGVVLYQLPSGGGDGATTSNPGDGQQGPSVFYSVDAYGQLVRHETPGSGGHSAGDGDSAGRSEGQVQLELLHLQAAVGEKTREVDELRVQLAEAYATLERLKGDRNGMNGSGNDVNAATVTVISPSTPS